ncbi:hypothetical protein PR202_gb28660 [Eleusine coracana subsp. coracana]|uniref:Uncharacterized protein n=1 Tax=Eleusine coracana subsp. coracana TaxID=191504 RepID=A0AAV5FYI8_ELECO|nr:hypothetical protein PR202_gb28660 [Eleusine coracana subsp. coracana]
MEILDKYSRGSGQMVNKDKSTIFFSKNCVDEDQEIVQNCLDIPQEALAEKVADLLTVDGHWDEDIVRHTFIGIDAEAMLRTPIHGGGQDIWAWDVERHGMYTIRSAYKLLDAQ